MRTKTQQNKSTAKSKPIECLSYWDWTTLVAAWRYYEHRHTIASATFPEDVILRFWGNTITYGDGVRKQIARQFVNVDHYNGPNEKYGGWPLEGDEFGDCDRKAWRLFYWFLKAEVDNSWKKFVVTSGKYSDEMLCFSADGKWYAKEGYIRFGTCVAPYIEKGNKLVCMPL